MGNKVIKGLLFMFFFQLYFILSLSSLQTKATLPSDLMHETRRNKRTGNEYPADNGTVSSGLRESIKNEHGFGHGGGATGSGENSGSTSPNTQGGSNFIPVYVAAGSANNRHPNHHGAGNCNCNCNQIGFSTLVAASIVSLVFFV